MKFDTPADTNPIDQLKVVGQPLDRIDGPLKTTGTAPYAYERHDVVPNQAYGYVVGSGDRQGPHPRDGHWRRRRPRPASSPIVTAENAGKLGKGQLQHGEAPRRPRDPALPPGDRGGGGGDLRAGARRGRTGPRRLRAARRARSTSQTRRRLPRLHGRQVTAAAPPDIGVGDFERPSLRRR